LPPQNAFRARRARRALAARRETFAAATRLVALA